MTDEPLTPFTRRRIARLAEDALRRAEVVGVFPTPMEAVQRAAGVRERIDINELPPELKAQKPRAWKRILGALWFGERTVFIDTSEPEPRQLFTDGHEAMHAICEWHGEALKLDNEDSLFREVRAQIEAEANFGAGHLIFQGGRFHRRALEDQVSIRTPMVLAREYGASRHAALHHYVDEHPDTVGLLVAGRYPYCDGTLPIWRSVESREFLRRFGRLRHLLPDGRLVINDNSAPLAEVIQASRTALDPPSTVVGIPDGDGSKIPFVAEAFFNGHCHFVFVAERVARRFGRRVRLAG